MSRFLYLAVVPACDAFKVGVTDEPPRRWRTLARDYGLISDDQSWVVSFVRRGVAHVETLTHFVLHPYHSPVRPELDGSSEWFAMPALPVALRVLRSLRDLRPDLGMHFWKASDFMRAAKAPIGAPASGRLLPDPEAPLPSVEAFDTSAVIRQFETDTLRAYGITAKGRDELAGGARDDSGMTGYYREVL